MSLIPTSLMHLCVEILYFMKACILWGRLEKIGRSPSVYRSGYCVVSMAGLWSQLSKNPTTNV